ncbi:MAG: hypothetical protein AAF292_07290 [Pseudomonadota bacterium]
MIHRALLLIASLAISATAAVAQDAASVEHYEAGSYIQAASHAEAAGGADNLAFAARSLLADAIATNEQPSPERLSEARRLAEAAIAIDPDHIEGRIQLAISLSLTARPMSAGAAMRSGLGQRARDIAKDVLEDDPDNAYAHAYLAIWNVEVVRRGGRMGSAVMGASVRRGRQHYQAAIIADPDDAAVHWQWARVLTAHNAKKYRDEIDAALAAAQAQPTDTAIEGVMQDRARTIEIALSTRSRAEVEGLAAEML